MKLQNFKSKYYELAKMDDRLIRLQWLAYTLAIKTRRERFKNNHQDAFYDHIKPALCKLVGLDREMPPKELCSQDAYDLAYHHLYQIVTSYKYRQLLKSK